MAWQRPASMTSGLVSTAVLNSAGGLIFWWIAARLYPTSSVGFAAAALSATVLLAQVSELGLGTQFAGRLHMEDRPGDLLVTGLMACGAVGIVLGLLFALVAPRLSAELQPLSGTPAAAILFAAGVSLGALSSVLDQVLAATFRGAVRFARNATFVIARVAFGAAGATVAGTGGIVIVAGTVVAVAASLLVVAPFVREASRLARRTPRWSRLRALSGDALSHHVLNLSRSASIWLLPLIATIAVSSAATASFYVALMLTGFVTLIGSSASFTLYVMGVTRPELMKHHVRVALVIAGTSALVGGAILVAFGRPLLGVFGGTYASAYIALVMLALTSLPVAVRDQWLSIKRARGHVRMAAWVGVVTLSLELGSAAVGARLGGIDGLAFGRLIALALIAAVMLPSLGSAALRAR